MEADAGIDSALSPDAAYDGSVCADGNACDDGLFCNGLELCVAGACASGVAPCAGGCDEDADACAVCDTDEDGHAALLCGGDDCDDAEPAAHPDLEEICDGIDNDCDSLRDEGDIWVWPDADGDSFGDDSALPVPGCLAPGRVDNGLDCDDDDDTIHPSATDFCDGMDNDCTGAVDDGGTFDWYPDCDGDGHGDASASPTTLCAPPDVPPSTCAGGGWALIGGDCDDTIALVHPGVLETCNRIDDDCSSGGGPLSSEDEDDDGHAATNALCSGGALPKDDCDDNSAAIYLGAPEFCDRVDQNCSADGGVELNEDADEDGHAPLTALCMGGPLPKDDCDDTNGATYLGAAEVCDGMDNDCSTGGGPDLGEDADGDGHALPTAGCAGGAFPKDDCDDTDPATYPGAPLVPPGLLSPENGAFTGSAYAAARGTLRPAFRWIARGDCATRPFLRHDIEIDDSCSTGSFATCAFPSAELQATGLTTTSYLSPSDLPVSGTAPVGRRYYWRARSCDSVTCSVWSGPRYVDVGRVPSDFNGDGWSDVVVGAYWQDAGAADEGNAFVYYGSAAGIPAVPSVSLDNPANQAGGYFGYDVASAGDVNGDGYADLIVGAYNQDAGAADEGNVFLYYGSAAGVPTVPSLALDNPANQTGGGFGYSVASAGDVNGDGYADVVVGALFQDAGATEEGNAFIYHGGVGGLSSDPRQVLDNPANRTDGYFGSSVASAGDVNGDGYTDLIIGARQQSAGASWEGNAFVYHGGPGGIPGTPNVTLDNPTNQTYGHMGVSVASAGDVNGDGYADVVVGADRQEGAEGSAFVYYGRAGSLPTTPNVTLRNPQYQAGHFGIAVASAGDLNGDGYSEVVVGAPSQDAGAWYEGNAFVFYGNASGIPTTPSVTLDNPANQMGGLFGSSVGSAGDANGDGYSDLVVGAYSQDDGATNEGNVFTFDGSASGIPITPSLTLDNPANQASGWFGASVASAHDANEATGGVMLCRRGDAFFSSSM